MSQPTPSFGFRKFKIIECNPDEFKKKNFWGKLKIQVVDSLMNNLPTQFVGKLETCSKSFYISGNFKTVGSILYPHENSNIKYTLINPDKITTDDMNYFMMEMSPGPLERQVLSFMFAKLPMATNDFKKLEEFEKYKFATKCDYFRMEYEMPLKLLFSNQKQIKLLDAEQLMKLYKMVDMYPWKACYDKFVSEYDLKEAKYKGFNMFKSTYKKKVLPLYSKAIRLYSFMKDERERGNDLFHVKTLFRDYFNDENWRSIAYEQNDKDMSDAFDFLMFHAISYVDDTEEYVGLIKDVNLNFHLNCNFQKIFQRNIRIPTIGKYSACLPCAKLSELQKRVIEHAIVNHVTFLEGAPGTGKTEVLVGIMSQLCMRDIGEDPCGPIVVTYIGMMVDALTRRFGDRPETANTIHYICCKIENTKDPQVLQWIESFNVLIIDEGSNVDVKLFGRLIRCMSGLSSIVIVGDLGQIFPIKPGCPFYDLVNQFQDYSFLLTENMRVDKDSKSLAEAAALIRNGEAFKVNFEAGECLQMITDRSDGSFMKVVSSLVKNLEDSMKLQIVTLRKMDAKRLNRLYEDILISKGILKKPKNCYNLNGCFVYPGKKIVFTKKYVNEKYDTVRNGEMGQVKDILKNDILVLTNGKKMPLADVELTTGYATTCNKAQGSEWENVIFWIYENPNAFFTREFPYVAISRAKKKCIVFGNMEEFNKLCKFKAKERRTIFRYFISSLKCAKSEISFEMQTNLKLLPMGEYAVCLPPEETETTKNDNNKKHFSKFEYTKDQKKK